MRVYKVKLLYRHSPLAQQHQKKKKKSSSKRFIIMFIPVFPLEWLTSCYQLPVCRPHNFCDMLAPGCLARCFPAHFTHASVVLYSSRLSRLTSKCDFQYSDMFCTPLVREVILRAGISCAGEVWEEGKVTDSRSLWMHAWLGNTCSLTYLNVSGRKETRKEGRLEMGKNTWCIDR